VIAMNEPGNQWSFCVGRLRGVEIRLHILFPLLALGMLRLVQSSTDVKASVAFWILAVLMGSVALHELVRVIAAARLGGHTSAFVLAPFGGFSRIHLPADPPAHLVAALVGPMTLLALIIAFACGLALDGNQKVHHLLNVTNPGIDWSGSHAPIAAPDLASKIPELQSADSDGFGRRGLASPTPNTKLIGQLIVWLNWCLLLVSLLPMAPCAGAELLRGILWPIVGRNSAASATSHIALGGALMAALFAILFKSSDGWVPIWFPLAITACVLLYGGMRHAYGHHYDLGLAIDEFDSDDEEWLMAEWHDDDREAVLVEHLPDKQQEAIDRKRREQEASEDERVDAILQRMHHTSFEQLSEEERTVLKRASRRYQDRRNSSDLGED
jgi:hypothetical protein